MAIAAPRRVYLHIGSPKTGTTFLQHTLHSHMSRLEPLGVYYPPPDRLAAHHDEARDLRGIRVDDGRYHHKNVPGSWDRMVADLKRWDGDGAAVISSEILAFADRDTARRAVESLQPAEIHVVVTMRDLARQIPAAWQEIVKNRGTLSYEDYLAQVQDPADPHGPRNMWDAQDPESMIERWAPDLPAEQVHLVTVPPRGQDPGVLWDRFVSVLGVGEIDLPPLRRPMNVSLGLAEAEVIRHLNHVTSEDRWRFYNKHVKHRIAQGVFAGTTKTDRLALPDSMLEWVRNRTKEVQDYILAGGYHVVGDLADLDIPEHVAGDARSAVPEPERLAEAWRGAAEYLVRELADRSASRKPAGPRRPPAAAPEPDSRLVAGAKRVERVGRRAAAAWRNR